jgi:hypothetical protein
VAALTSLAGILAALAALPLPSEQEATRVTPSVVRIYVHAADDGSDAQELAARRESVADVAAALATKKKVLSVVSEKEQADVLLELIERGWTVPKFMIGLGARPGQPPGAGGTPMRAVQLRVRLRVRDREETVDFTNKNTPLESSRGWKSAADDLAGQIEKWVAAHRDEIHSSRALGNTLQ